MLPLDLTVVGFGGGCAVGGCAALGRELCVGKDLVPRELRLNQLKVRMCRWRGGWVGENQGGGKDAGKKG